MKDTQKRYTDRELIAMLQILASDLNKRPTHRDILDDDRLPTHHTYIKRFGSVQNALEIADLDMLEDRSYTHKLAHEMLVSVFGDANVAPYHGDTIKTYSVDTNGNGICIDYVDLQWSDGPHPETLQEIQRIRSLMFESSGSGLTYHPVTELKEIALLASHYMDNQ